MFDICEFCRELNQGSRQKRLPFGPGEKGLVILQPEVDVTPTIADLLLGAFPEATILWRNACLGVDLEEARIGCGILIRNVIGNYKIVVLPTYMTQEFFGQKITGSLVEWKSGQYIIPYDGKVLAQIVTKEYERALKQC